MEQLIQFARWTVTCDPVRTRATYDKRSAGGAESCGCDPCRNFAAARERTYPRVVRDLFDKLGVDYLKEAEVFHTCRLPDGLHSYGAWFHFLGSITSGRDAAVPAGVTGVTLDLERVTEHFQLGFTSRTALVSTHFGEGAIIQVEIAADVPWLIGGHEPD